jgi:hypothetical protein
MAEEAQPTEKDKSTEDMWDLNRKMTYDGARFDDRVENLNQKMVADAQAQALFWTMISERQAAAKLSSVEYQERQQSLRERQDQHSLAVERGQQNIQHQATLNQQSVQNAQVMNEISASQARAIKPVEYRTIEPTREEALADSAAAGVVQGVESVARAMTDRTQTSAANVAELSGARQVADTNILNTLSELAGIVNVMQTEAASTQASFQALSNQVSELIGAVQALSNTGPATNK